jgi:hypothetical protein
MGRRKNRDRRERAEAIQFCHTSQQRKLVFRADEFLEKNSAAALGEIHEQKDQIHRHSGDGDPCPRCGRLTGRRRGRNNFWSLH